MPTRIRLEDHYSWPEARAALLSNGYTHVLTGPTHEAVKLDTWAGPYGFPSDVWRGRFLDFGRMIDVPTSATLPDDAMGVWTFTPIHLKWGLKTPPEAFRAWGMRAEYDETDGRIRWCGDRADAAPLVMPDESSQALEACVMEALPFNDWLTAAGWLWLEQHLMVTRPADNSEERIVHSLDLRDEPHGKVQRRFVLEASPRRSYGYMYVVAYEQPVDVPLRYPPTPTPSPAPKPPERPGRRQSRGLSTRQHRGASRW